MGFRTMLCTWLGVDSLEAALDSAEKRTIDRQAMRKEIADALMVVFSGEDRSPRSGLWFGYLEDHGGRFERTLRKVVADQAVTSAQQAVAYRVDTESFIDEIVARVRRKQLDA